MTIMLNEDSAGSAPNDDLAVFDCGWCMIRMRLSRMHGQNFLQVSGLQVSGSQVSGSQASGSQASRFRASAAAARLRAANDNQLAWPYLAFADDWYASC